MPHVNFPLIDELRRVKGDFASLSTMDPFRTAEMALEIQLEKMHVAEAMNARDAAVQRLADAYTALRQKTAAIERLLFEKEEILKTPGSSLSEIEDVKKHAQLEVARLEGICQDLRDELQALKCAGSGGPIVKAPADPPPSYEEGAQVLSKSDMETVGPATVAANILLGEGTTHIVREQNDLDYTVTRYSNEPEGRMDARYAVLASLPIPPGIPEDALRPIVIPPPISLHEFLVNIPGAFRNSSSNYRVFQQLTTSWCPEREEHGYFITPAFRCSTNPRVITAHRWARVDVVGRLSRATECFYSKDGKWYYAGVYTGFKMDDLTTREWEALSNETTQALIKETLAARKNVSPQNFYETAQLYAAGALKVGCVGIRCIGFNNAFYHSILEQAEKFSGRGGWRSGMVGCATGSSINLGTPDEETTRIEG